MMSPNRRRIGHVLAVACLFASASVIAAPAAPADTGMTVESAREDLDLAIKAVEAAIPNLYWHQTRGQWVAAKADALGRVSGVTDSAALWRILRPLMAQIGEGHLSVQSSDAMTRHFNDAPRFPLDLLWTGQGAFVLAGFGGAADIPRGARLISIDGVDEAALLREMVTVTAHDGVIQTATMRAISGRGFASFLFRLRGVQSKYHVVLDGPSGRIERDLEAVPPLARPSEDADPSPLPTLDWIDGNTAYLNVPTFSNKRLRSVGATFPEAIHAIFVDLQKRGATNLILDLRENGGGSEPNESILFSYLVEKPLHKYQAVEARGRTIAVTSLSGKRFETEVFDDDEMKQQRLLPDGHLARRNVPPEGLMSRWVPYAPIFHGRLVVLAGGTTFSGGAELASMLHHTKRGVFVGEEVGGTYEGNTSGYRWTLVLPNSGISLYIPLLRYRMAWSRRPHDHGVQPDCPVLPNAMQFGERRDRAWQVAAALLEQTWQRPRQASCAKAMDHAAEAAASASYTNPHQALTSVTGSAPTK